MSGLPDDDVIFHRSGLTESSMACPRRSPPARHSTDTHTHGPYRVKGTSRTHRTIPHAPMFLPIASLSSGSATIFTKEPTVRIQCQSGSMLITIKDAPANLNGQFSGMVYPKGLAKNSTCLTEYHEQEGPLRYKLPLKSCNTMPIETVSGTGAVF